MINVYCHWLQAEDICIEVDSTQDRKTSFYLNEEVSYKRTGKHGKCNKGQIPLTKDEAKTLAVKLLHYVEYIEREEQKLDSMFGNHDMNSDGCPYIGNGGYHSDSYGEDGDGSCKYCGKSSIKL